MTREPEQVYAHGFLFKITDAINGERKSNLEITSYHTEKGNGIPISHHSQ